MFKLTIMKKKYYKLLTFHMNPDPDYLFGHAEIAGMLAKGDEIMSSYEGYKRECSKRGVVSYNQESYNQFMEDCERPIKLDLAHLSKPDLNDDYWLRVKPDIGNCM